MILDAGALVAVERRDRNMALRLRIARDQGERIRTYPMAVAQVWRGGARQAELARALHFVRVESIDADLGRRAGELLGKARTSDPIGAAVVLLAADGEVVVTSDRDDITRLAEAAGRKILVVEC